MAVIAIKDLLEAGVHFGHQTRRWNPRMKPFVFEERNGIYIIDLQKSQRLLDYATQYVRNMTQKGGKILFIGTKKQAKETIREVALQCKMPYVCERWLGGMLTNMQTIRLSIGRLEEIEDLKKRGVLAKLPKKEQSSLRRELAKLHRNLDGIRNLDKSPDAVFIVDIRKEHIALAEARKLGVTVVAIVDTNCDPDKADFIIPGNDDAISSIKLLTSAIGNAAAEGAQFYNEIETQRRHRAKEERDKAREKKPSAHKPPSKVSKELQDELTAKAEASASPENASQEKHGTQDEK